MLINNADTNNVIISISNSIFFTLLDVGTCSLFAGFFITVTFVLFRHFIWDILSNIFFPLFDFLVMSCNTFLPEYLFPITVGCLWFLIIFLSFFNLFSIYYFLPFLVINIHDVRLSDTQWFFFCFELSLLFKWRNFIFSSKKEYFFYFPSSASFCLAFLPFFSFISFTKTRNSKQPPTKNIFLTIHF